MSSESSTNPAPHIDEALVRIRSGDPFVLFDSERYPGESFLCMAAQALTSERAAFLLQCSQEPLELAMPESWCARFGARRTADKRAPMEHGLSVRLQARSKPQEPVAEVLETIRAATDPRTSPEALGSPGRVVLRGAMSGGVLERNGYAEAAVDLAMLAQLPLAMVIARVAKHTSPGDLHGQLVEAGLAVVEAPLVIAIPDLVALRFWREMRLTRAAEADLPTSYGGTFRMVAYENLLERTTHLALVKGDVSGPEPVLVRIHSKCLTGDVLGSQRCDCGPQLQRAMQIIDQAGRGVIVYLDQEGRGIGLVNKLRAYVLQDQGHDTITANEKLGFAADLRDYGIAAEILEELGIHRVRLLTNNPLKLAGLEGHGLEIAGREPLEISPNPSNQGYLRTKRDRMGHMLTAVGSDKGR